MHFHIVDVFAEDKYQGNQLAVFQPDADISQEEMQQIAKEMNFSETTFIMSGRRGNGGYDVKIFTPDAEIPFAGHPSLGTAYVIRRFMEDHSTDQVLLNLNVGQVPVVFEGERGWMTQNEPAFHDVLDAARLADTLQISQADIEAAYPVQSVSTGLPSIIVPLATREAVDRCRVEHRLYDEILDEIGDANLLVFAPEPVHADNDLYVRVFMFTSGHLEDPATGSANGNLAAWLLQHSYFKNTNLHYKVEQGLPVGRPSLLHVAAEKESSFSIQVGGHVFVTAEGTWI
ncbi:PhzF family phenazine biosynthesis protein [Salibacterium qingdaonense]|uniref:Trans-2,3-dihydro-3-hydroxyanthranilate isomerase n=1 Tax=Salibacterium qingdaonense TaxID=266892 RepID=A0A1I4LN72_9BACI|nr:PhzF family phenazine biosynthesis protein [Salibacterium qingdaonense]SFL92462.1 trans-2,3-dihydro-3-hydroxyanthranilate isomerase [Salibacterium qingdaonense]